MTAAYDLRALADYHEKAGEPFTPTAMRQLAQKWEALAANPTDKKVYIAGPIKGMPDGNRAAFAKAAALFPYAVNPFTVDPEHDGDCPPGDASAEGIHTYPCHVKYDLKAMLECDAIYLLKGWENSAGARVEFLAAQASGLTILYQD